ncbi:CHAP domain-containing protein [Streptomyces sp. MD20-1-1]|uniref:CHAP domain-containing protein n=1 Tax=Streptomyces sp. MD20-1-1 TaxID=3028668 RepID=UPI0029AE5540|nr:CHAP domain-containing protein [Streptomyces sp. MD20-1-1]
MSHRTSRLTAVALSALLAAGVAVGPAQAGSAGAGKTAVSSASSAQAPTRQQIVAKANEALTKPTKYKTSKNGSVRLSKPKRDNNYLGGRNLNEYNNYNGQAWCGYFAAAMWGKQGVPTKYPASQQWRTGLGKRFHAYNPRQLPQPGDVLVWSNRSDARFGHVGVVVAVKGRTVSTVEGNAGQGSDSVTRRSYDWKDTRNTGGPYLQGKNFRGFSTPR